MFTEDKITEIFCMADDFCKFFDAMTAKYTLKPIGKRKYHRNSTMSKAEVILIMILFHTSGYRCFKHFYLEKTQFRSIIPCEVLLYIEVTFLGFMTYSSFCRMESSLTTDIHWCSQQFKRFRDISTFEIVQ